MSDESSKISQFIEGLPWEYQVRVNNATIYMRLFVWPRKRRRPLVGETNEKKERIMETQVIPLIERKKDSRVRIKRQVTRRWSYVLNVMKRVDYPYARSSQKNISKCLALIPSFKLTYLILYFVSMYCQNFQIYYILVVQVSFPSWLWNHLVSLLRTNLYFLFSHFFFYPLGNFFEIFLHVRH